jgi:hydroxymethylbilane synthase
MLPEPGQGALGLELRCADGELAAWCREGLDHLPTRACVLAERAFLAGLGGGCHLPIAAYAQPAGDRLHLAGAVVAPDGSAQLREEGQAPLAEAEALGARLAQQALARGAKGLLSA